MESKREKIIFRAAELHPHSGKRRYTATGQAASDAATDTKAPQNNLAGETAQDAPHESAETTKETRIFPRILSAVFDVGFYLIIFLVLAVALVHSNGGAPRVIFGYSFFTVLTPSMQSEIPQGSFVIVKNVDVATIEVGDDITYMKDAETAVTHRVVEISDDYEETGAPGFRTWGIENEMYDGEIVFASNVVGKVVYVMPGAGRTLSFIKNNVIFLLIMAVLLVVLLTAVRNLFRKDKDPETVLETIS